MKPQQHIRRVVDRVMDLDSPTYGDERERAVFTEASTFGLAIGIYVTLAAALAAAVLGALALPAVLLLLGAVPAWSTSWYARARGVDVDELATRAGPLARVGTLLTIFTCTLLIVGAMAWTVFTGQGLVTLAAPDVAGPDASGIWASLARGAVIGALAGGCLGFVAVLVGSRRRSGAAAQAINDED